jgi:hypothetical protein
MKFGHYRDSRVEVELCSTWTAEGGCPYASCYLLT